MATQSVLILILIFSCVATGYGKSFENEKCCEEYCYDADKVHPQNGRFNSLTAYDFVKGTDLEKESKVPSKLKVIFGRKNSV